jgi:hypothetical protein
MSAAATLLAGFDYVRRNPLSLVTAAREAARLRLAVPLDLLRWGLGRIRSGKVSDFAVSAQPPGLGLGTTVSVMGQRLRVAATLRIEEITVGPGTLRTTLRVQGLTVDPLDGAGGPVAALLSSGAIDLKKPGNLMGFLPQRPAMIVEAEDDRFVLDLLQIRALERNTRLQKILGLVSPVVSIREVETSGDELIVGLRVTPGGLPLAIAQLRM